MRAPSMLIAAVLAASSLGVASAASALVPADVTLTAGPVSTVVSVSPDVFYDAASSTYYLFTTGPGTGAPPTPGAPSIGVYSSSDGTSWSPVPGASTPSGAFSDPSVIAVGAGSYRMYVTSKSGTSRGCTGKQLRYATSTDLHNWTMQPQILVDDIGCGVPQVVASPEGFRLYYVSFGASAPRKGECSPDPAHGVYMRESKDGLVWGAVSTRIAPTDMVDPSVVQLSDGSWLMFAADFSQCRTPGFTQKLYVGTSSDGLTWDFGSADPLYTADAGQGAFDPDAVVLPDGSIRAWWAQGTSPDTAVVASGTVTVAVSPDPDPEPVPPSKPTVTTGKPGIAVSWTYAVGAPAPDAFVIQVKSGTTWKDVARTEDTTASVTWTKVGAKKGKVFSVRVLAVIGDESAASPSTRATRPR